MNRTVLFLVQPSIGHIIPVLCFGRILRNKNFNVVVAGNKSIGDVVLENNFKFISLNSLNFAQGFEKFYNREGKPNSYLDILLMRVSNKMFNDRKAELTSVVAKLRPSFIGIDQFLSSDVVVLKCIGCAAKLFILQTMFPTIRSYYHPPLNTPLILGGKGAKLLIQLLWLRRHWNFMIWRMITWIKYLGYDDMSILYRQIRVSNVDLKLERYFTFNYVFKGIAEFICCPQELEFNLNRARSYHSYLGFLYFERHKIKLKSDSLTKDVVIDLKLDQSRLIYCSFGTRFGNKRDLVDRFMRILIRISRNQYFQNYVFVISCGELHDEFEHHSNSRIHFVKDIDQFNILNFAKLFITHGGLNSIKEAIYKNVPMLVYPLESYSDQPGNAARVEFHKLGIRQSIDSVSETSLSNQIRFILKDSEYAYRLIEFNRSVETEQYSIEQILSALERL